MRNFKLKKINLITSLLFSFSAQASECISYFGTVDFTQRHHISTEDLRLLEDLANLEASAYYLENPLLRVARLNEVLDKLLEMERSGVLIAAYHEVRKNLSEDKDKEIKSALLSEQEFAREFIPKALENYGKKTLTEVLREAIVFDHQEYRDPILNRPFLSRLIDVTNLFGQHTLLHIAAYSANPAVVEALIKLGVKLNETIDQDKTAFHLALKSNDIPVLEVFLKYGVKVEEPEHRSATLLSYSRDVATLEFLIQCGAKVSAKDKNGLTPLHWFSGEGAHNNTLVVQALLKHKPEVDARDDKGRTPLHHAAKSGEFEIVELLIQSGANPNAKDRDGNTPMIYALKSNSFHRDNTIRRLEDLGAKMPGSDFL